MHTWMPMILHFLKPSRHRDLPHMTLYLGGNRHLRCQTRNQENILTTMFMATVKTECLLCAHFMNIECWLDYDIWEYWASTLCVTPWDYKMIPWLLSCVPINLFTYYVCMHAFVCVKVYKCANLDGQWVSFLCISTMLWLKAHIPMPLKRWILWLTLRFCMASTLPIETSSTHRSGTWTLERASISSIVPSQGDLNSLMPDFCPLTYSSPQLHQLLVDFLIP